MAAQPLRSFRLISDHHLPTPLQATVARAGNLWLVIRRWLCTDAECCQLCTRCTFEPGRDGEGICIQASKKPISPDDAPSFSPR